MSHLTADAVFRTRLARNALCNTMTHLTAAECICLSTRAEISPRAFRQKDERSVTAAAFRLTYDYGIVWG